MARGLNLTWMSADGRLEGDGMHWSRGNDYMILADVDGDGQQEVLIANNNNGAIGILKWSGGNLRPIWIDSDGRLPGVHVHWSRGADDFHAADIDGDGQDEIIVSNAETNTTGILKWVGGALTPIWINNDGRLPGNGVHWSRGTDVFKAIQTGQGPRQDVLVFNFESGAIGVLRWTANALTPIHVNPNGISGNPQEVSLPVPVDLDGDGLDELWCGTNSANSVVCKWNGTGFEVIWRDRTGRIPGEGIHWSRGPNDQFLRSRVAGGDELLVTNYRDWIGTFRWDGATMVATAVQPVADFLKYNNSNPIVLSPLRLAGKNKDDILFAKSDLSTGIIGGNGQRLANLWVAGHEYFGDAGVWEIAHDDFYKPFRIQGQADAILLCSNVRSWTAVLTWLDA